MALLFAVMLVTASGNTAMHSLLPAIGTQLRIPDVWVSLAFSWSALLWVFTAPVWARMSDHRGRKKLIHMGLFGFSVTMLLSGVVLYLGLIGVIAAIWTFVGFGLLRTFYGGLGSAAPPAVQAYVAARTEGAARTKALSLIASSLGLGTVAGPAAAPYLIIPALGLASPLLMFALIGMLVMFAVAVLLPGDDPRFRARGLVTAEPYSSAPSTTGLPARAMRGSGEKPDDSDAASPQTKLAWSDTRVWPWILTGLVGGHAHAMVLGVIGFLVMDRIGLRGDPGAAVETIGLVLMSGAVATLLAQWGLIPMLSLRPRPLVIVGLALAAFGGALISHSSGLLDIVLGFSIFSLGFGLFRPGFTAGASLAVERHEQGGVAGMVASSIGASFVVAPAFGVWLYSLDARLPFLAVIMLCVLLSLWGHRALAVVDDMA